MNIQIGEVIRTLRLENNVTQEELANHLGVSTQAVSRWENGACYPDLEFIPGIASYFSVSTDRLLCVDSSTTRDAEDQCIYKWKQAFNSTEHQKALDVVNDMLKSMPTNYRLMLFKVQSLIVLAGEAEERSDKTQMRRLLSEAEDLLRLILSKCNKNSIRQEAMGWMMVFYGIDENKKGLLEFANEFPDVRHTKNSMLYRFCGFEGDALKKYCRECLYELFFEFFYCSYTLAKSTAISNNDRIELLERLLGLLQSVVCDNKFGEFEYLVDGIYEMLYSLTGKEEYGSEVGRHLQRYKELPDEYTYKSVFFDGVVFCRKNTIHAVDGSL